MHCQCGVVIYLLNLLCRSALYLNEPINMGIRANCIPLKILPLRLIDCGRVRPQSINRIFIYITPIEKYYFVEQRDFLFIDCMERSRNLSDCLSSCFL